jgi:hypothetical protein
MNAPAIRPARRDPATVLDNISHPPDDGIPERNPYAGRTRLRIDRSIPGLAIMQARGNADKGPERAVVPRSDPPQ